MCFFSPCFVERSRSAEEAAQINFMLNEIPRHLPHPQHQSVDPSTTEPAHCERRNSSTYEEMEFGTLNDGRYGRRDSRTYENLNDVRDHEEGEHELDGKRP